MRSFFSDFRMDLLFSAGASLLLGLVLVLFPDTTSFLICYLLAAVMILCGGVQLLAFFFSERSFPNHPLYLARSVLLLALGIYLAIRPGILISILPMAMGLLVTIAGLIKVQNAVDLRRIGAPRWNVVLLLGLATTLLGIVTLFNPFAAAMTLLRFLGAALLVFAGLDIAALVVLMRAGRYR
jgi:uncharacterized membrane protein HdeD (DUF308 family)